MNARDFAFWLNGFFEMSGAHTLSAAQVKMVKEHLALVFQQQAQVTTPTKIDPRQNSLKDINSLVGQC